ncbi:MAG: transglycosylase domain-containing protein, partial [Sphingomonadales bacterium]|nr:transglycosylase domain-containing protein [Sphingomonadales bacterium]
MADRDDSDPWRRHDAAFDPYYRSRDRGYRKPRPEPSSDHSELIDPDFVGYTEYGREYDDRERVDFPRAGDTRYPPDAEEDRTEGDEQQPTRRRLRWRLLRWALYGFLLGLLALVAWLAIAAPVSRTARPLVPPQMIMTASDGTPIARMGPVMDRPVVLDELPQHVVDAFISVEDRRFYDHWGIDPQGIARALWTNITSDTRQGGSTITQQLAKLTYLDSGQTIGRKIKEVPISLWLELWLDKDEILERYLSNAYFGDNVYGLRAASLHYFYRHPENLTLTQAAMLAGLVKAPSRLAPTRNLEAAQQRERVVLAAMVDAGYLAPEVATATPLATVDHRPPPALPRGTYFADWAAREARETLRIGGHEPVEVRTTLDRQLQALAERITRRSTPAGAQVALVAMRPDGEVVAMVGGRDYADSTFNRATQAERQPGSTFKLIVYLAALRSGMTPETMVEDSPIETGDYRPSNAGGRYRGRITLREAFAYSSNVVAVRLYQQL